VTQVPVLPLADAESAMRFHRMLTLHVARLKHRAEPVGLHQFLLGQVLGLHHPEREGAAQCADCGQRYPCGTTLLTALLARLPVRWTRRRWGER